LPIPRGRRKFARIECKNRDRECTIYMHSLLLLGGVEPNVVNAGTCRTCLVGGGLISQECGFDRERCDAHQLVACKSLCSMPIAYTFFEPHVPSKPANMAPVCTIDRHRGGLSAGRPSYLSLIKNY
jgi:hypothetical protein